MAFADKVLPQTTLRQLIISTLAIFCLQPLVYAADVITVANDKVGIGVATPSELLHLQVDDAGFPRMFRIENIGNTFAGFSFSHTGGTIDFNNAAGPNFRLNHDDGDGWEFNLDADGNLTITGEIVTAGSCSLGCDRVFSSAYELPTIEEHAAAMWENQYLPAVGPTVEGQPINLTNKVEGMLNELEKAHIYIDQLHDKLNDKELSIAALEERFSQLEAQLESRK